jgi:hypothetical protein
MNRMQRRMRATGSAAVKAIVAVAVVVVVGAGVWYFTSDVFKTKVDAGFTQATKWTPENIAKDPVNYLNFVEGETTKAQQSLKASRIAVAQNRAKLETMKGEASNKIKIGEKAVKDLLESYKSAVAKNAFPINWNGKSLEQEKAQQQALALNKEVTIQKTLLAKVEGGLKKLDAQESKIGEAEANAQSQLAEIQANRELLKVQSLTDDLKDKLVSMQSAVAATVGAASDTSSVMSLDQLAAESATAVDTTAFDKLLQGSN